MSVRALRSRRSTVAQMHGAPLRLASLSDVDGASRALSSARDRCASARLTRMQSSAWLATRKSTKRSVESSANASTSSVAATADIESPLGDSMSTARRLPRDTPALSMLSKRLTMLASKGCVSRGSSALKRIAIGRLPRP